MDAEISSGCQDWFPKRSCSKMSSPQRANLRSVGLAVLCLQRIFSNREVPYVPTPPRAVQDMLKLAEVTQSDILYDLGCGDGRILIEAARTYGAHGVGLEHNPELVARARQQVLDANLADRVRAVEGSFEKPACLDAVRLPEATVVTCFLLSKALAQLWPVLHERLRPGTRLVSYGFKPYGDAAPPDETASTVSFAQPDQSSTLYLWRCPTLGHTKTLKGPRREARIDQDGRL